MRTTCCNQSFTNSIFHYYYLGKGCVVGVLANNPMSPNNFTVSVLLLRSFPHLVLDV